MLINFLDFFRLSLVKKLSYTIVWESIRHNWIIPWDVLVTHQPNWTLPALNFTTHHTALLWSWLLSCRVIYSRDRKRNGWNRKRQTQQEKVKSKISYYANKFPTQVYSCSRGQDTIAIGQINLAIFFTVCTEPMRSPRNKCDVAVLLHATT